jgi:hypothetical protein
MSAYGAKKTTIFCSAVKYAGGKQKSRFLGSVWAAAEL